MRENRRRDADRRKHSAATSRSRGETVRGSVIEVHRRTSTAHEHDGIPVPIGRVFHRDLRLRTEAQFSDTLARCHARRDHLGATGFEHALRLCVLLIPEHLGGDRHQTSGTDDSFRGTCV